MGRGKVLFSHCTNHSGGVAILFERNFNGNILESHFSTEGRWIVTVIEFDDILFLQGNVYGYNNSAANNVLLQELSYKISQLKSKFPSAFLITGGDFNEAPNNNIDRFPSRTAGHIINPVITDFCNNLSLLDPFRFLHPSSIDSFTWFKSDMSKKSRIDLWLISNCLSPFIYSCEISPAPLTDYAGISLLLSNAKKTNNSNSGYWKLNC